jgi:hypothetical protein
VVFVYKKKHLSFHLNFVVNYFIDGRFTSVKYAFDNAVIKWKTKNTTLPEQFQNSIANRRNRGKV